MKSGIELITFERLRQISEEGWTPEHDDDHSDGSLAIAAACYATPVQLFEIKKLANSYELNDPWVWEQKWDKRFHYGERRTNPGNTLPDPKTYTLNERIDLLTKAGALIAAEIDRLLRADEAERLANND